MAANNALFNVDGGHRAIKYTRLGGVGKEIYAEGMGSPPGLSFSWSDAHILIIISLQARISKSLGSRRR